jgi:hypothetical protein
MKPSDTKMKEALHAVITGQLAAFRADDFAGAYAFADPQIKEQFPLEAFERMVRTAYPAIAKSVSASFGLTFDNGDEAVVEVHVTGADGKPLAYHYLLRRDGERWRISGVFAAEKQGIEV